MYSHDDFSCTDITTISPDGHDVLIPTFNLANRTGKLDLFAKLLCHLDAQNLRSPNNTGVLSTVRHTVELRVFAVSGVNHGEIMQQAQLGWHYTAGYYNPALKTQPLL
ncbi:hypothetical protein A9179_12845 [Pseudomonas alcaligenes]|uniref:Uncharacterized protein n=1 Tax=Aquipseudomonas alcaligenes TaxID=43263 RepID=A0ABR7S0P6_AQUAC|nr:hypothetical protein [Pseudomonas alcaligenes]